MALTLQESLKLVANLVCTGFGVGNLSQFVDKVEQVRPLPVCHPQGNGENPVFHIQMSFASPILDKKSKKILP